MSYGSVITIIFVSVVLLAEGLEAMRSIVHTGSVCKQEGSESDGNWTAYLTDRRTDGQTKTTSNSVSFAYLYARVYIYNICLLCLDRNRRAKTSLLRG